MRRILVIEDDRALARSILLAMDLLEMPGLEKEAQCDGIGALARLRYPPMPDVLLLDMRLPDLAGKHIYAEIREKAPDCKVIVMTGDTRLAAEIQSRQGDWEHIPAPCAVFVKPFSLGDLLAVIRKCLDLAGEN